MVLDADDGESERAGMSGGKIVGVEVRYNCDGLGPVKVLQAL